MTKLVGVTYRYLAFAGCNISVSSQLMQYIFIHLFTPSINQSISPCRTTPVGVISLIGVSIASIASVQEVFAQLGLFIAAITVGIVVQQLVVMSAIFFLFTRRNPYKFLLTIARPWMIAFAATST